MKTAALALTLTVFAAPALAAPLPLSEAVSHVGQTATYDDVPTSTVLWLQRECKLEDSPYLTLSEQNSASMCTGIVFGVASAFEAAGGFCPPAGYSDLFRKTFLNFLSGPGLALAAPNNTDFVTAIDLAMAYTWPCHVKK